MVHIAPPTQFVFQADQWNGLDNEQINTLARTDFVIRIDSPNVRLRDIKLRIRNIGQSRTPNFIRVFFIKFPSTIQSEPIHFFAREREKYYSTTETEFWMGFPFYVEAIAFAPQPPDLDFRFQVDVYRK